MLKFRQGEKEVMRKLAGLVYDGSGECKFRHIIKMFWGMKETYVKSNRE